MNTDEHGFLFPTEFSKKLRKNEYERFGTFDLHVFMA
jgi:hypothetical protein